MAAITSRCASGIPSASAGDGAGVADVAAAARDPPAVQAGAPRDLPADRRRARRPRTYSNRFAAHILRQHQFARALPRARLELPAAGRLGLGTTSPTLRLPRVGPGPSSGSSRRRRSDTEPSEIGHLRYSSPRTRSASTARRTGRPVPLDEVPAARLLRGHARRRPVRRRAQRRQRSELGRSAARGRYRRLLAELRVRRALAPAARPAARCSSGCCRGSRSPTAARSTTASSSSRGDCAPYKIHLGSGNILMEPNDQYLCIVPDARRAASATRPVPAVRGRQHAVDHPQQGVPARRRHQNHRPDDPAADPKLTMPPPTPRRLELPPRAGPASLSAATR